MEFSFEKDLKVLLYIASYCHSIGAEDFHMEVRTKPGAADLSVISRISDLPAEKLSELTRQLALPRQKEVEESYWELSADNGIGNELSLVGMMTDGAEIGYADGVLSIRVRRVEE